MNLIFKLVFTICEYYFECFCIWRLMKSHCDSHSLLYLISKTTYAISAYHHWCCGFDSRSGRGVHYYVIKYVSVLREVGGFFRVLQFPSPKKKKWPPRYNWNIVESGVKPHKTKPNLDGILNLTAYSIQHYVIKFASNLRQVGGFSGYSIKLTATI